MGFTSMILSYKQQKQQQQQQRKIDFAVFNVVVLYVWKESCKNEVLLHSIFLLQQQL